MLPHLYFAKWGLKKKIHPLSPLFHKRRDILILIKAQKLNLQDEARALCLINLDLLKTQNLVLIFLCHQGPVLQSGLGTKYPYHLVHLTLQRRKGESHWEWVSYLPTKELCDQKPQFVILLGPCSFHVQIPSLPAVTIPPCSLLSRLHRYLSWMSRAHSWCWAFAHTLTLPFSNNLVKANSKILLCTRSV